VGEEHNTWLISGGQGTADHPYFGAIMSYYATNNDMSSATDKSASLISQLVYFLIRIHSYAWMGTTDLSTWPHPFLMLSGIRGDLLTFSLVLSYASHISPHRCRKLSTRCSRCRAGQRVFRCTYFKLNAILCIDGVLIHSLCLFQWTYDPATAELTLTWYNTDDCNYLLSSHRRSSIDMASFTLH
jgi:hypothetical protein